MILRAKAPLRISFGGGGTDISPYAEEQGGAVLNATIDQFAYCTLTTQEGRGVTVNSMDFNLAFTYNFGDVLHFDGSLDLVKAALRVMAPEQSLSLTLHSDAPPGTGLGSSSAVVTSIVGAFKHLLSLPLSPYQIAELAYKIEREEAGLQGGRQDHYAAAFGGFNFMQFNGHGTQVTNLRIHLDTVNELQYRLLLCQVGRSHVSAEIIQDFLDRYRDHNLTVVGALDETKSLAFAMRKALILGDLNELGELLHQAWQVKKRLSARVSDEAIDRLYEFARQHGALGGKLLGAGGAGYLLLLASSDKKHILAKALEEQGASLASVVFHPQGVQTWQVA